MKKFSLVTAILLLSSAWMLAQSSTSPSSQSQYPSSSPSAQQPSQSPDTSQSPSSAGKGGEAAGNNIEGCVGGSAGNFTLTDASGKTYQLAGDTSKLAEHVGHQVRITGTPSGAGGGGSAASAGGGATPTLNVKKVKMVSATCTTK